MLLQLLKIAHNYEQKYVIRPKMCIVSLVQYRACIIWPISTKLQAAVLLPMMTTIIKMILLYCFSGLWIAPLILFKVICMDRLLETPKGIFTTNEVLSFKNPLLSKVDHFLSDHHSGHVALHWETAAAQLVTFKVLPPLGASGVLEQTIFRRFLQLYDGFIL